MAFRAGIVALASFSQMLCTQAAPVEAPETIEARSPSYYIDPTGANPTFKPWPNGEVNYCMEGVQNNDFVNLVGDAWVLWVNAFGGSAKSSLMITLAGDCKYDTDGHFLHVTLTNDKYASTSLGYQAAKNANTMRFDMSGDWGLNNAASNLAHEFGHAFGLIHEHQKASAWIPDRLSNPPRPDPLVKLNCQNLADYQTFKNAGRDMNSLCSSQTAANAVGFSARDILPWPAISTTAQSPDFDWSSIMLYSSDAGAKTVNGAKQPTLVKYDGSRIDGNLKPSAEDGQAIQQLYPKH